MSPATTQLVLLLVLVLAYFLLVLRPQRSRLRALREVQGSLAPGRRVLTSAGLMATVHAVEDGVVVLEIAPGTHARFAIGAVVRYLDEDSPTAPGSPGPPGSKRL